MLTRESPRMYPHEDRRPPPSGAFWTPPPNRRPSNYTAAMPMSERKRTPSYSSSSSAEKRDPFHIVHKVPSGDSPYVRAKHAQLIEKDPSRAVSLFWAAINAGDRVDSALKDMAVVMKQLNRPEEGIEAIKSFRYLCPFESQDSIDNLLLELYKKSGRIEEEARLLEHKLKELEHEMGLGGRTVRAKRVHGKHVMMTIEQEMARILGNLGWVNLQLHNYGIAEQYYRRALCLQPDKNKLCNLAITLMRMGRIPEAKSLINEVADSSAEIESGDEPFLKSYDRAVEMLAEIESKNPEDVPCDKFYAGCSFANGMKENIAPGTCSPAPVRQNSEGIFSQPRGKWDQNGMFEEERRGAARKLTYGSGPVKILKRGEEPVKGKILDQKMIQGLHKFINKVPDCMESGGSKKSWADIAEEEEEEEAEEKRLQEELKTAKI